MKRILNLLLFFVLAVPFAKAQPKAGFSATPNKGCSPATIKYTNQSTGTGLSYYWDLGNGNTSTIKDPQAIYYSPGLYSIKLIVTDNTGKKDSITRSKYVEVFKNPVADFDAKTTKGCTPFDPGLTDKSTRGSGMITQWTWDYGNGKVVTGSPPAYAYTTEGVYTITLLIKDANGCQSDAIKKQYITSNSAPQVIFSSDKTTGCTQPLSVNFTNKSNGLKTGDQFEWDFGDGTKSTTKSPSKTYTDTGSFSVTLTIKSANECNTSSQLNNYITISKPKPSFNHQPSTICENSIVTFYNTSKPVGFNYVCSWDFGDGNKGSGNKATNKYKTNGKYTVQLTVSLPDGSCKETITVPNAVNVLAKPIAKFTISDTLLCKPGLLDTLIDKSVGGNMRYWYLNDSLISTSVGVIIKIKKKASNKIMLVSGNGVCYDTLKNDKAIYTDTIKPNISVTPKRGCKPLDVTFTDLTQSRIPITSRFWDLGDGSYQNQQTFNYTYTISGVYFVSLVITTEPGCTFTVFDTIRVGDKPKPFFTFPKTSLCNNEYLEILTAVNKNSVKVDEWKWFLDSSLLDSGQKLKHKIRIKPKTYDISLVTGNNGCYDTFTIKQILRILPPLVNYMIKFDSCSGYPYTYMNTSDSADEIKWVFNNNSVVKNRDTIVVQKSGDPWPVRIWGTNYKSGCVDSLNINTQFISRGIGFSLSGNLCSPANLTFSNSSYNYTFYSWKWGDGTKKDDYSSTLSKIYTVPGKYTVWLIARESNGGCKDSISKNLTITGPKVSMEVTPKTGCGPLTLTLISKTSDTSLKNKFWKISGLDSFPVTADTMYYTLKKPGPLSKGRYAVNLTMNDPNGCTGLGSDTVQVFGLNYHLQILTLATCSYPKLTIRPIIHETNFDEKKLNYFWDIGDGRKFTGSPIDFWYKAPGIYKLNIKVIDENNCVTERDTLIENNKKSITADLLADKLEANCPPLRVNFVSKSQSKFGKIEKYYWDFGDGSTSTLASPSHVYIVAGKFSVTLTVIDELGCQDKITFKDLVLIDGPVGKYKFDRKSGCTPLFVNFDATVSNTSKLEWDMGDGEIISDTVKAGHSYTRVGKYIPLLVLADSFGCKYTLPPIDTIEVYPIPLPQFKFTTPCIKQPIYFTNTTNPLKGSIKRCEWNFGDGDTSMRFEPSHIFKTKGVYTVKLKVWNSDSCEAQISHQVVIKNTAADFKPGKTFYCAGQTPSLINTSQSDTTFRKYHWFLNDALISKQTNPALPPMSSGLYKITLAIEDNFGCTDTLNNNSGLLISDTLPPIAPFIYRVSVENDNSVILDFSSYRSFDFKEYSIYKSNNTKIFTITNINDTSRIINSLNTLSNVYCYKVTATNLCGSESDVTKALEHCTVETKATGALKRVDLAWNAYKGWQVNKYEIFREDIGEKGKYDYLATVGGNQLNYTDTNVYCKIEHFYKIKAFENGGYNQISWSDTTAAKPLFANSVPPNSTIRATVDFDKEITIEWTGSGSPRIPIQEYVLEKSEDGIYYKWYKSFAPDEFSFTDKKVLVDDKSYFYRTYAIDTCELISPITNFAKTILLHADTTVTERPFVTWSSYQDWNEGVNEYEVQRKNADGSFVTVGFTSAYDSLLVDNVTDLNGYPYYCYRVIGYKNMINGKKQIFSISNEDCAPVRSRIFAANAFTINGDNLNETFDIKGLYIRDYNIKIFNRWGDKVFESSDMNVDWDGYYNGKLSQMDAYIWIIKAIGVDDVSWPMTGTVTIIR